MNVLKKLSRPVRFLNARVAVKAVACGAVLAVTFSICGFSAKCDNIRNNVLRLHVLANSDSPEDQALKLKVKDAVLAVSDEIFSECESESEAAEAASRAAGLFQNAAENVIFENGYAYPVTVEVADTWFEKRIYDDFTLPAGTYEALRVVIGSGEGHNWWCVMFPALCLPAASETGDFSEVLSEAETDMVERPQSYAARFKVVELFEKARRKLGKIFG